MACENLIIVIGQEDASENWKAINSQDIKFAIT